MRALLMDYGFTISVLIALIIAVMFAYLFEASLEQVATLGMVTAVAEYVLRSRSERPR